MEDLKLLQKKFARLKKINLELEGQIEELSRDSYEQFKEVQEVYDVLEHSIIIINAWGEILQSNSYSKENIPLNECSTIFDFIMDEKSKAQIFKELDSLSGEKEYFSAKIKTISGETKPFSCGLTLLKGHSGKKFVFTAHEITNLKKEELKRAELQRQLMQQSFKEGMAESAVSILHNIGNVLTGMILSIDSNQKDYNLNETKSNLTSFITTMRKMEEEETLADLLSEKEKRSYMLDFLQNCSSELTVAEDSFKKLTKSIRDKAHHIGSIISIQQQYADLKKGIKTSLTIDNVMEDCLLINESKIVKPHIRLTREWDGQQSFCIEKNGFIQVLSNTLINAIEAIETKMGYDKNYTLGHIKLSSSVENNLLVIRCQDDAMGFSEEVGKKLFNFGFSTKERSSGFGLHNCHNFMTTQGGNFEITSEGENQGATVKIYIPLNTDAK